MKRVLVQWIILVLTACFIRTAAADLVLVRDGTPKAVIVTPAGRDWEKEKVTIIAEQQVAAFLNGHIEQMSGVDLPIVNENELGTFHVENDGLVCDDAAMADRVFIIAGEGRVATALGVTSKGLEPGGIRLKTVSNAVVLVGHPRLSHPYGDGGGLRHAAVTLLNRLGCRYLWPGETGKVIPQSSTVILEPIDVTYNPPIKQRRIRTLSMSDRPLTGLQRLGIPLEEWNAAWKEAHRTRASELAPDVRYGANDLGWIVWHGLGGDLGIGGGHSGCGLEGGWEKHGKEHPEWFALQADGSRSQEAAGDRWRLCVSNTGLVEYVATTIIERLTDSPTSQSISLSPNDGGYSSFCMCDNCRHLDPTNAPLVTMLIFEEAGKSRRHSIEYPALTDRYVHYWNAVAERVTDVHPDALFSIDAYSVYSTPPVRERLHPNLIVRYVPSTTNSWAGWQAAGAERIFWRPNILLAGRRSGKLHVMLQTLADTMAYMLRNGCLATDFDSITHYWALQGLNYYAAARLNWDPTLEAETILEDYCNPGFGSGAPQIRRYFLTIQEVITNPDKTFSAGVILSLRGLLNEAEQKAADEPTRERVRFLRMGLNVADVYCRLEAMAAQARASDKPVDKDAATELLTLNYMMLRDIAKHHPLVVHPYLVWGTGDFAGWAPIGGRAFRPPAKMLARIENANVMAEERAAELRELGMPAEAELLTMTGREDSITALRASLGLDGEVSAGAISDPGSTPETLIMEADENGAVLEMPGM